MSERVSDIMSIMENGTWQPVRAGDVTVTPDGCGHALRNTGSVPLEFVALILDS